MKKITAVAISLLLFIAATPQALAATVVIVDTGLNPSVVGGSIVAPGYDFVNDDAEAIDDEPGHHGTAAGSTAVSMVPSTGLIPVKAYGSNYETSSSILDAAFNYTAGTGAQAASHSIASINDTPLSALQAVTNAGIILVMQAGNAGASSPTGDATKVTALGGRGIIAGGLLGGSIWSASNRAGGFQDYYLTAEVKSATFDRTGTSMATPRIAAVAARVAEASPHLSPEEVVQVLFQSATDLGAPGVDPTYGHGAVNLSAALNPVGEGEIPSPDEDGGSNEGGGSSSDDDGGGGGAGLAVAALVVGGAVAYSLMNKKEDDLKKTIFTDKFGRAFNIDLSTRATTRSNTPLFGLFNSRQQPLSVIPMSESKTADSYSRTIAFVDQTAANSRFQLDPVFGLEMDETRRIGFRHDQRSATTQYAMGLNADLSGEFGALSLAGNSQPVANTSHFLYDQVFTTPALGYSTQGTSFSFGWNDQATTQRFGVAVIDDQEKHGAQSNSILYESRVDRDDFKVGFQMGALIEDGSLFGGASDSAFGADQTSTYYLGLNGSVDVSDDVSLIGGYFQGFSDIKSSSTSVLDQFDGVRTEGYGFGLLVDNALSPRGKFGLAYSSPMQTTSGSARLTLPTSQNRFTGAIGYESSTVSFDGADREKIIEAYYGFELTSRSDLFAHYSYTKHPVSELDMDHNNTFYLGWRRQF